MVAALAGLVGRLVVQELVALDWLDLLKLIYTGVRGHEVIAVDWGVWVHFLLLIKVLRCAVFHFATARQK